MSVGVREKPVILRLSGANRVSNNFVFDKACLLDNWDFTLFILINTSLSRISFSQGYHKILVIGWWYGPSSCHSM